MNGTDPKISVDVRYCARAIGTGISRAISISNTKKITANMKKRSEKGRRAELFGSNPHSKGDAFSWLSIARCFVRNITIRRISGIAVARIRLKVGVNIPVK